jgi:nitrogen fixation/metabolism regulation signal transduction histidine kinase
MEEHGGGIELNDSPYGRGAWIRLKLRADGIFFTEKRKGKAFCRE